MELGGLRRGGGVLGCGCSASLAFLQRLAVWWSPAMGPEVEGSLKQRCTAVALPRFRPSLCMFSPPNPPTLPLG